jgi:hypothetical protein
MRLSGKGIGRNGSIKVRGRGSGTFWRRGPAWEGTYLVYIITLDATEIECFARLIGS